MVFPTNHSAGTSKTNIITTKSQQKTPKQQSVKTTNTCKTKPNETIAWFRSPFAASGQEMDRAYSTDPVICTWL